MLVHRGFLMTRNASGKLVPFFIKVRAEDIIGDISGSGSSESGGSSEGSGEISGETSGWRYVAYSDRRLRLSKRFSVTSMTYVNTNICKAVVSLPYNLSVSDTTVIIGKDSGDSEVFGPTVVEGSLTSANSNGYSGELTIKFISISPRFTEDNINGDTITVSVELNGYSQISIS